MPAIDSDRKLIGVRVSIGTLVKLDAFCDRTNQTRQSVVERALIQYLRDPERTRDIERARR
jgi:hypothetical protein